ncbi:MAG: helix-turn-helix domain-containing protein [Rhizomicrobium sp.]
MQAVRLEYLSTLIGRDATARLISRSGLAPRGVLPGSVDLPTFWRLCTENIQLRNDETHGVAAEPVPRGSLSVLFTAAKEADTLLEALKRFTATARLIRKECRITLRRSGETIHLTTVPRDGNSLRAEIYVECFTVVTHCALRWMTGRRLDPVLVRGSATLRGVDDALLASLHAPMVRRGAGATIVYSLEDMQAPILAQKYKAWGDQEFESFRAMLEEHDGQALDGAATGFSVRQHLRKGLRSEKDVSDALHWSVATLRRRLTDEGMSFRRLSAEVRSAQLQDLLATETPIADIAEKMGFSDDRSLRRFCRDNFGRAPSQYRQLLRGLKA